MGWVGPTAWYGAAVPVAWHASSGGGERSGCGSRTRNHRLLNAQDTSECSAELKVIGLEESSYKKGKDWPVQSTQEY